MKLEVPMKTFFKRMALCIGGLLVLLILFHLVENWRGKRAWQQWKQARIAAGDSFDPTPLIPPVIPDEENFARAPRIAEAVVGAQGPSPSLPNLPAIFFKSGALQGWRMGQKTDLAGLQAELKLKDLKEVLTPWEAELAALTEAAKRPHCRLVKNYENLDDMPQLLGMRARARMLSLRALIALREKREDAALEDVLTGLRVAGHLQKEPHLLSQLLRIATVNLLMQPIWEGLQEHRWNGAQLLKLQDALGTVDLVASYKLGWQFERLHMIREFEKMADASLVTRLNMFEAEGRKSNRLGLLLRSLCAPKGWLYQNMLTQDRYNVTQFNDVLDPTRHRIGARSSQAAMSIFAKTKRTPYTFISRIIGPALADQNLRMARAQSSLDMALIACALERHRLEQGGYPETLAALAPVYLPKAPVDVIEGQPLRYAPKSKEAFQLYSLGWNLTDEGGQVAPPGTDGTSPQDQGDWVWSR
jgi:hypothetical protein